MKNWASLSHNDRVCVVAGAVIVLVFILAFAGMALDLPLVHASIATGALIGIPVYIRKSGAAERERRKKAGVPGY